MGQEKGQEGVGRGSRIESLLVFCRGGPLEEGLQWHWSEDSL